MKPYCVMSEVIGSGRNRDAYYYDDIREARTKQSELLAILPSDYECVIYETATWTRYYRKLKLLRS